MNRIIIVNPCSYDNLATLKEIYRKETWELKEIRMEYNPQKGLPMESDIDNYPVTILCKHNRDMVEIKFFSFTCGYGGCGPSDFADILDFLGIKYDKEDIYTKKRMGEDGFIRLKYVV